LTGETLQVAKSPPRPHKSALKSAHFVLSAIASPASMRTVHGDRSKSTLFTIEPLFMAIPKRLLKRAVDRNAVKRICREAWRLKQVKLTAGLETSGHNQAKPKLVKLVSLPKFESTTQLKYLMRSDIDALFAKFK
jgi:ribonuclease P protein component